MPQLGEIPTSPELMTPGLVQRLLATLNPGVGVEGVGVRRVWEFGQGEAVSTSGRIDLDLVYASSDVDLPRQVVLKIARPQLPAYALYRNEVAAYTYARPWEQTRSPRCLGAWFDEPTGSFGLALEDLTEHGARFPSVLTSPSLDSLEGAVLELASWHSRNWGSRADWTSSGLSWAQSHVSGELHELFTHPDLVPRLVDAEVNLRQHKRELVQSAGQTTETLLAQVQAVQRHQANLVPTLLHGDCHVGNTYVVPGGQMGFLDWQLSVKGYFMHDLSYLITTGLEVEQRRTHERSLIEMYLEELRRRGAAEGVPTVEEAFEEHRRAQAWNTYIGWLTAAVENYGWEINVVNHIRLLTAYRDLESDRAIEKIP